MAVDLRRARFVRQRDDRRRSRRNRVSILIGRGAVEAVGIFLGDEAGGEVARAEPRVLHQRGEEIDVVADALDLERVERLDLRIDRRSRVGARVISLAIIGS